MEERKMRVEKTNHVSAYVWAPPKGVFRPQGYLAYWHPLLIPPFTSTTLYSCLRRSFHLPLTLPHLNPPGYKTCELQPHLLLYTVIFSFLWPVILISVSHQKGRLVGNLIWQSPLQHHQRAK